MGENTRIKATGMLPVRSSHFLCTKSHKTWWGVVSTRKHVDQVLSKVQRREHYKYSLGQAGLRGDLKTLLFGLAEHTEQRPIKF